MDHILEECTNVELDTYYLLNGKEVIKGCDIDDPTYDLEELTYLDGHEIEDDFRETHAYSSCEVGYKERATIKATFISDELEAGNYFEHENKIYCRS